MIAARRCGTLLAFLVFSVACGSADRPTFPSSLSTQQPSMPQPPPEPPPAPRPVEPPLNWPCDHVSLQRTTFVPGQRLHDRFEIRALRQRCLHVSVSGASGPISWRVSAGKRSY